MERGFFPPRSALITFCISPINVPVRAHEILPLDRRGLQNGADLGAR